MAKVKLMLFYDAGLCGSFIRSRGEAYYNLWGHYSRAPLPGNYINLCAGH